MVSTLLKCLNLVSAIILFCEEVDSLVEKAFAREMALLLTRNYEHFWIFFIYFCRASIKFTVQLKFKTQLI